MVGPSESREIEELSFEEYCDRHLGETKFSVWYYQSITDSNLESIQAKLPVAEDDYGFEILAEEINLMHFKHAERTKARTLPNDARKILKDWFNQHFDWPYPSGVEKADLQQRSNLSRSQINNWFINERKRNWRR